MTETPEPAELKKSPASDPIWSRVSVVWLVPLLALAVTLGVAWHSYSDRGMLIEIDFADATGITPNETQLKFREVTVGTVETVGFSADLQSVKVGVRVHKDVAPYIDKDARFWLVRPEVSAQGISRLDTVLSGTFIEGWWDAQPSQQQSVFEGLDRPPVAPDPTKGTVVELSAADAGGLAEGAPIIYRGLTVGRIQNLRLNAAGTGVIVDAYVEAPYDARMTTMTRFWNTSGVSFSLGTGGVSLSVRSLASLVQGGVEFDTLTSGGGIVENGRGFRLYESAEAAKTSIFGTDAIDPPHFVLLFDDPVDGLARGAKVQFRGVEAGEVTDISIRVQTDAAGTRYAQQQVIIALSPERLGLTRDADAATLTDFLAQEVRGGLRARVAGTGLLGTTLVVELVDVPDQPPATIALEAQPYPTLPTAPPATNDLAASARDVVGRVANLPIEKLMDSAIRTLDSIAAIADSQETRAVPVNLSKLLNQMQVLVAQLNEADAAGKAAAAMTGLTDAAGSVMTQFEGFGDTLAATTRAADAVGQMPLGDIGRNIDGTITQLRGMLGSEDAAQLPKALADTLQETAALLAELRAGGAADKLNGTLSATQDAAQAIRGATDRVPELTGRLDTLVRDAQVMVNAYSARSDFNNQLVATMRELQRATQAFGSLARMIERNPRAFILGR